ncbi:hypothetical protein Vadar_028412 [Vaccinium darrowii]|uniref:Uncharacterized protein n=1 Tax=Vaccinium darrowii TaxID=229202 RepID=A0ACB7XCZ4_9ERIC|nr:hypothetical protein Vadar_028412 [Vaccinium darrowii]
MPRPSTRLCVGVSVCEISLSLSLDEHHRCLHDRQHADTAACTRAEHHHHHRVVQRIHEGWFPYSMLENETKRQHSKLYESHRIDLKTPTPQFGQCSRTLLQVSLG